MERWYWITVIGITPSERNVLGNLENPVMKVWSDFIKTKTQANIIGEDDSVCVQYSIIKPRTIADFESQLCRAELMKLIFNNFTFYMNPSTSAFYLLLTLDALMMTCNWKEVTLTVHLPPLYFIWPFLPYSSALIFSFN